MASKYKASFTTPSGQRKYVYAATKKELNDKLLNAKIEAGAGIDITNHTKVSEWFELWIDTVAGVRPQTLRMYRHEYESRIDPVIGRMELRKLTPIVCSRVFRKLDEQGCSHSTQKLCYTVLHMMLQSATDNDIILKNPCNKSIKIGGAEAKTKDALTVEQAQSIRKGIERFPNSDITLAFFDIALGTGLRIGEILGLRWSDVDLDSDELSVNGTAIWNGTEFEYQTTPKSKQGFRRVPFDKIVHDAFVTLKSKGMLPYCFMRDGQPMSASDRRNLVERRLRLADPEIACSAHVLRHTYITRLSEHCTVNEMMRLAGHGSSSMTDHYTHYTEDQYQATKRKLQSIG